MYQHFDYIRERDIDFLLVEELNINSQFSDFIFQYHIPEIFQAVNFKAIHSVVDEQYGETDIFFTFSVEDKKYAILIENKINAPFQPDQPKRYQLRKNKLKKENKIYKIYTALIAPEKYIDTHNVIKEFDIVILYEDILHYFYHIEKSDRSMYKAMIINDATTQSKCSYIVKENPQVTLFWQKYWTLIRKDYSYFYMKEPNLKPFDADWALLSIYFLPKNWIIKHKWSKGIIDLQTTLDEETISKKKLHDEMSIAKTGKSFSIRLHVPKIDRLKDFETQINEIKLCLDKVNLFYEIKDEIYKNNFK